MASQVRLIFEGRVQGVGFRWTTRNVATSYNVAGYVKNLPDGTVEVLAQGQEPEILAFTKAVEQEMGSLATRKSEAWTQTGEIQDHFEIRY